MLPAFKNIPRQSSFVVSRFGGINVTETYEPGEVTECNNISSESFPAICARKQRTVFSKCNGVINGTGNYNGIFFTFYLPESEKLFLHYGDNDYEFTNISHCDNPQEKRKFATLENRIIIVPDNIMFFTDTLEFKTIDVNQVYKYDDAKEKLSKEVNGSTPPINTSSYNQRGLIKHNSISAYSVDYKYEGFMRTFYFIGFDPSIEKGDVLTIKATVRSDEGTGEPDYVNYVKKMKDGITVKVKDIVVKDHSTSSGFVEETVSLVFDDNSIDTGGYSNVYFTDITIERKMPATSLIASFNNRIWAVLKNNIHASKLGEPDEWNDFSVDSYGTLPTSSFSSSSTSDGDFTAIIPCGNFIYAFKENHIHKIYGDTPGNFAISAIAAPGVMAGSDTACVCGVNIMYVSCTGVCILRDGYPKIVSKKLGNIYPVCATANRNKYYVIGNKSSKRVLYIYDSDHDIWTMENCNSDSDNLCTDGKNVFYSTGGEVICISSDDYESSEKNVSWNFRLRFEAGRFSPATSIRAVARVRLEKNASFTVRAFYDDDTRGALCGFCFDETPDGCTDLRLPIKRNLGFYLEFKGTGGFTLRNIKFNYYKSDIQ